MLSLDKSSIEVCALARRIADLPPYLIAEADRRRDRRSRSAHPSRYSGSAQSRGGGSYNHRYPDFFGLPEFRGADAGWYRGLFGVELDSVRKVVSLIGSIGSKQGIAHMSWAFLDPGTWRWCPTQGILVYGISGMLASGTPHLMPLLPENGCLPDLDTIPTEVLERAKLIWLSYQNNPTDAIAPRDFFDKVIEFAHRHHLLLCHDNPYSDGCFDGYRAPRLLESPGAREIGVEFHSLSKTYNTTGWRIRRMVGNASVVSALGRTKSNIDTGVFKAVQCAGVAALTGDQSWLADRNMIYQRRRDLVLAALWKVGIEAPTPRASLYVWARVSGEASSPDFSLKVLDEVGVWVTPGIGFGPTGEGIFRISLTCPDERLKGAVERLGGLDLSK